MKYEVTLEFEGIEYRKPIAEWDWTTILGLPENEKVKVKVREMVQFKVGEPVEWEDATSYFVGKVAVVLDNLVCVKWDQIDGKRPEMDQYTNFAKRSDGQWQHHAYQSNVLVKL